MYKYLALFRGINVSGKNIIKMQELKTLMLKNNYNNVKTYIQSGNVIFESENSDYKKTAKDIERLIETEYGYIITVFVTDRSNVEKAINNNPFISGREPEPAGTKKIYVTFLSEMPAKENVEKLLQFPFGEDEIELNGDILYFKLAKGAADSKLSNSLIENKLKLRATTRNWNTTLKLLEMLDEG